MVFSPYEFMTLATFAMCNDKPEDAECIEVDTLHSILDKIAINDLGFDDWIQAYIALTTPNNTLTGLLKTSGILKEDPRR